MQNPQRQSIPINPQPQNVRRELRRSRSHGHAMKVVQQWRCDVCKDEYFDDYDDAKNHEVLCRFQHSQELRFREETFRKIADETWKVQEFRKTNTNRKGKKTDDTESKLHVREASKPEKQWTCEKCKLGFSSYVDAFVHELACTDAREAKETSTEKRVGFHERRKSLAAEEHGFRRKSKSPQRRRKEMRDDIEEPGISTIYIPRGRKEQRDKAMAAAHQLLQEKEQLLELSMAKTKRRSSSPPPKQHDNLVVSRSRPALPLKSVQFHRRERSCRYDERSELPTTIVTKQKQTSRSPHPSDCDSTIKYLCKVCEDACFNDMESASAHESSMFGIQGRTVHLRVRVVRAVVGSMEEDTTGVDSRISFGSLRGRRKLDIDLQTLHQALYFIF